VTRNTSHSSRAVRSFLRAKWLPSFIGPAIEDGVTLISLYVQWISFPNAGMMGFFQNSVKFTANPRFATNLDSTQGKI
jgi:hypothetical protein